MKCSYCKEPASLKCDCQQSFTCQNNQYENLDIELGNLRISYLRSNLIKRIEKIKQAKMELSNKTKELIQFIQKSFKQTLKNLDEFINFYSDYLKGYKFFYSNLEIIENIESFDLKTENFEIDEIVNKVHDNYTKNRIIYVKTVRNGINHFLNEHNGGFHCGAITDDFQTLVTGGFDSVIRVWDLVKMQQKFVLFGHNSDVKCISLTKDAKYIISGSYDASVRLWDIQKKSQFAVLKGHKGAVKSICYIEKGSLIVSGDSKFELIVWDFPSQVIIKILKLKGAICNMILLKNQSCIITSEGKKIIFIELENFERQKIIEGHSSTTTSLALASDEKKMVSGSNDQSIIVWDLIKSKKIFQIVGHEGSICALALTLDDQFILSGSSDETLRVWDMRTGVQVSHYKNCNSSVLMILRMNQIFLTLLEDSGFGRLELETGSFNIFRILRPFLSDFVDFSTKSRLIGYGSQKEALVWDFERNAVNNVLLGHLSDVQSVEVSLDCQFALSCSKGGNKNLIYWDLFKNKKIAELEGHTDSVFCTNFSKDGLSAASGSGDKTVRLWNLREFRQEIKFLGHIGSILSIKLFP